MFKKIGLFFFSVCLVFLCLSLTTSFILKINIRSASICKYIEENDFSFLVKTSSGEDSVFLKETKTFLQGLGISSSVVDQVIQSDVLKQSISDYSIKYVLYYLREGEKPVFDATLFKKILRENSQVTSWLFKTDSKQEREKKQKLIEEKIDEYSKDVLNFFPTIQNLMKRLESEKSYFGFSAHQILDFISFMMSREWIVLSIVLMWGCLLFLFWCGDSVEEVYKSLFRSAFTYISILIVAEILLGTVIKTMMMERLEVASVFINYMVNVLSKDLWVFVIIGILTAFFFKKYPVWIQKK